ncbi:DUF4041 domain-containing protein [Chryseobacterium sp. JK1]|uniref:GIY-YIG nuclease family protein n=1 Tax=Chryseobacterium sp. JK1 TaxID=874294 RepID=UPI003D69E92D
MEIVLIFILLLLIIYIFGSSSKFKKESDRKDAKIATLNTENDQLKTELSNLDKKNKEIRTHNDALRKYQDIIDIKAECEYLLQKAQRDSLKLKAKAELELSDAQEQAKELRRNVKELTEKKSAEIGLLYENAVNEAKRIVENAETRAENIGGDAYRSLKEADQIADRIKAMKNVIKGYGNEYLIPTYTLLDELAEDFGHKEAGENLKKLRQNNKLMIVNRQAGICDYMDEVRRNTAIDFVIDAYNGKVDSILAGVKKDNFGTLKQKMDDVFQLVNFNGQAFRNARISEIYHSARLEELRWAVVAQELKWQEQEEQRQIREQIREEERARREYEKAMKDAEKEELTLKKLIEKAESQAAKANEEQRILYLQKLEELQQKLTLAEEKNQRAISMAQQTRTGNVYIISNIGSFGENVYKIGMTRRLEPLDRVRELGDASVPFEFDVHAMIYSEDAPALEKQLHRKFMKSQLNKINPRKEFFKLNIHDIKNYMDTLEIGCKWTMMAEAKQYRETLKLEEEMITNKQLEAEWEQYQEVTDPVTYDEVMSEE